MTHFQNSPVIQGCPAPTPAAAAVAVAVAAIHGPLVGPPSRVLLQELAIIQSYTEQQQEALGLADRRKEIVHALGDWLLQLQTGPQTHVETCVAEFKNLMAEPSEGKSMSTMQDRLLEARRVLVRKSGIAPSLKELNGALRGDKNRDPRTLRREIKKLNLPTANQKTKGRIRDTTDELSGDGKKWIDPATLRIRLQRGNEKIGSQLPDSQNELLAFCVGCGAKLLKKQLILTFFAYLDQRDFERPLGYRSFRETDFDLIRTLPAWARQYYGLERLGALRAYAESIGLKLRRERAVDRDDLFARPPRR